MFFSHFYFSYRFIHFRIFVHAYRKYLFGFSFCGKRYLIFHNNLLHIYDIQHWKISRIQFHCNEKLLFKITSNTMPNIRSKCSHSRYYKNSLDCTASHFCWLNFIVSIHYYMIVFAVCIFTDSQMIQFNAHIKSCWNAMR